MAKVATSKSKMKKLPDMADWSDEQIAEFWETHDSTDYLDQMEDAEVDIRIPPDFWVISLRLEREDVERAKRLARRRGVPYTVLLRMWIKEELKKTEATR